MDEYQCMNLEVEHAAVLAVASIPGALGIEASLRLLLFTGGVATLIYNYY